MKNKTYRSNIQDVNKNVIPVLAMATLLSACGGGGQKPAEKEQVAAKFTGTKGEVKLMTLDLGHFHAALIQKSMYEQINPTVYVYAPEGDDVNQHLGPVDAFNKRADNPTDWVEKVYTGNDYLEKMLAEKPGNVMMVAGNNAKKPNTFRKQLRPVSMFLPISRWLLRQKHSLHWSSRLKLLQKKAFYYTIL